MDDDGDMAEMCLTEKRRRSDASLSNDCFQTRTSTGRVISKSAPNSPERSVSGLQMLPRTFSGIANSSKYGSSTGSSDNEERIQPLEMLLEAYFIVIDNTLNTLSSVWEV
jgi:magnesium transporter